MNINKMNRDQLNFLLEINNNTLESIRTGETQWRNAMIQSHVETGEMTQEEFDKTWEEMKEQNQLRVNDIEQENLEIYKQLQERN